MTLPNDTVPLDVSRFSKTVLMDTLKPHTECVSDDDLIVLPSLGLVLACQAGTSQDIFGGMKMTPLTIIAGSVSNAFEPHRFTLVGLAKSAGESIQNGISQWIDGAVPMLKAVFGEEAESVPGVSIRELDAHGPSLNDPVCWRMYQGQYTIGVVNADGGSNLLAGQLDRQPLMPMLRQALSALDRIDAGTDICWLSIYLARQPEGETTAECLLNGEVLEGAADALRVFEWPDFSPVVAFVRQYAIFKRLDC